MNRTILIFCQVYPPDPAGVGQQMADAAAELARRGHRVIAITANRGYDDPSDRYPRRETRDGVDVRRVPFSSFGKDNLALRAIAMVSFVAWCVWFGLTTRRLAGVVVSTVPPICGVAAAFVRRLRGTPYVYWIMDLNPDQMVALGKVREQGVIARTFRALQRYALRHAARVVTLDRFMAERVNRILDVSARMDVFPPWPQGEAPHVIEPDDNWFRSRHAFGDRFVVMYSGNHGFSTPVDTLLAAADLLADEPRVLFAFIGGGVRKKEVDAHVAASPLRNVVSLPYQPLDDLPFSLSAADLHVVTMEESVVGIVHPCKIYGAMAVARPILLVGPEPCHASDILAEDAIGWRVAPGSAEAVAERVRLTLALSENERRTMGLRARQMIDDRYSHAVLCGRFAAIVEAAIVPA